MKKLLLAVWLLMSSSVLGQMQDLYSLAKGDYLGFNALFDEDENLYGYVAMYGYGKTGDKTKKFEYVFLDRNLNPVSNKEFEGDITASDYYGVMDFRGKMLLIPTADYYATKRKDLFYPRTMEVDLKTNTIKPKVYYDYDKGTFKELVEPKKIKEELSKERAERRKNGFVYNSYVYEIKEGGFLVNEYDEYDRYINNQSLKRFDKNKKLVWEFNYNEDGDKKHQESIKIIEKDDKHIYTILEKSEKKNKTFFLQVFDIKTGKILVKNPLEGPNSETLTYITYMYSLGRNIDNDKTFKDKIVMVGRNYTDKGYERGLVRMVIDKKTFKVDFKNILYSDYKKFLPKITDEGVVEKGYRLVNRDLFFLKDGSVGILMEKYKQGGDYSVSKTTDMVYAFTDKDFNLKDIKVFEKTKTKYFVNSDYLFSQYVNNGDGVVFFFRDYQKNKETKEKYWNLYINTLIEGKFNQEEVKISEKDNYFIVPYIGKEGYILLREFNEKDKFNKIRLERLNY